MRPTQLLPVVQAVQTTSKLNGGGDTNTVTLDSELYLEQPK